MLIILSGVDTINKQLLAQAITETFNTFTRLHSLPDIAREIRLSYKENHYHHLFARLATDWGGIPVRTIEVVSEMRGIELIDYQRVLTRYHTRRLNVQVISGCFSKAFIDKIRNDIGTDNVIALNIIRNPSVAFVLHHRNPEYYVQHPEHSADADKSQLERASMNTVSLIRFNDIITLRFEDIINNGSFTINNKSVILPEYYVPLNKYITKWEETLIKQLKFPGVQLPQLVDEYNCYYQNMIPDVHYPTAPTNLFKELSYSPLEYNTIV